MDLNSIVRELESPSPVETEEHNLTVQDIEKLASLMEAKANDDALLGKFASGVRILADEFKLFTEKRQMARDVVSELVKQGNLDNSNIISKLSELEDQNMDELIILQKALKLTKTGSFKLGSLSDQEEPSVGFGDNATEALKYIIDKVKGD